MVSVPAKDLPEPVLPHLPLEMVELIDPIRHLGLPHHFVVLSQGLVEMLRGLFMKRFLHLS